jgi:hypothetical protein
MVGVLLRGDSVVLQEVEVMFGKIKGSGQFLFPISYDLLPDDYTLIAGSMTYEVNVYKTDTDEKNGLHGIAYFTRRQT